MSLHIGIISVRDAHYHPNRRLMEAAGQAGHDAALINPYHQWPANVAGRLQVTADAPDRLPDVVLPRQGAQISDTSLALIGHYALLGVPLINPPEAIRVARNKFLTQQVLTAAGLPCVDTIFINHGDGFFQAVDRLGGFPVVTKPVSQRQGDGVLRITDAADAHERVLPRVDARQGLMVQRFLPPDRRIDLRVLVIDAKAVCGVTLTPPAGDFRTNFHLGAAIRSTVLSPELEKLASRAAVVVGCDVAGVDMMIDPSGLPLIAEVNYAPGFKGLEAATQMDIAGHIITAAVDQYHRHQTVGKR